MKKRKRIKKRYSLTVISILLAIFSVILFRNFDKDFDKQKNMIKKEIVAIMEFNKDFFKEVQQINSQDEKAKLLRDKFANKISYQKLLDKQEDFKNFKYLPNKRIYGFKLLNKAHVGFYYNDDNCGKLHEGKDFCAGVLIDTNGYTKPNRFGQDQFLFKIYKDIITD